MIRRIIRIIGFLIVNLFFLVLAIVIGLLVIPFGKKIHRQVTTFFVPIWSNILLFVLGIKVRWKNAHLIKSGQNYFVIGNHLSYLDVIFIGSKIPVLFVAKKEVKSWPLLGTLAYLAGSVFVDRGIKGAAHRPYIEQIAGYLKDGFNISIFPEGTSSNGEGVLPFKKSIFSCPVLAQVPILPIAIKYKSINHKPFAPENRDLVCWYADMTFIDHFLGVLSLKQFEVEMDVQPPVVPEPVQEDWVEQNRNLAEKFHDIVEKAYLKNE